MVVGSMRTSKVTLNPDEFLKEALGMTEMDSLPTNARRYVDFLSQQIGVEIGLVSTGPERMQTIIVHDSALGGWLGDSK